MPSPDSRGMLTRVIVNRVKARIRREADARQVLLQRRRDDRAVAYCDVRRQASDCSVHSARQREQQRQPGLAA